MNLTISAVSKQYKGDVWGLRDFSLTLKPGVLGLLGPNGAGKSTLMRILATVTKPTAGSVHWNDQDIVQSPNSLRAVLGYLPQDFGVYPNLTAQEFLEYLAAAKGLSGRESKRRIAELIEAVNLNDAAGRPLGGFSGGMRQRVGIAQALLNDPRLLIVDEPTTGLDPEERVRFRNLLSDLSGERIVILSTHVVSDVEAIATRIAIINHGRILTQGEPEALLREAEGKVWEVTLSSTELAERRSAWLVTGSMRRGDGVHARVVSELQPAAGASPVAPSLEDAYLRIIAESRTVAGAADAA